MYFDLGALEWCDNRPVTSTVFILYSCFHSFLNGRHILRSYVMQSTAMFRRN